jgi:hypothetical protein
MFTIFLSWLRGLISSAPSSLRPMTLGAAYLERIRRVGERQQHITSNPLVGFGPASPLHPRTAAFQCPHPASYGNDRSEGVRAPAHASIGHGRLRSVQTLRESSMPCPPLSSIALTHHTSSFARRRHHINHRSEASTPASRSDGSGTGGG